MRTTAKPKQSKKAAKTPSQPTVKVDWHFIRKEYNKLKCPLETHNPMQCDMDAVGYVIDLSDRSRGKTTNKLILGLLLFKHYGIVMHYVRQNKRDIEPKMLRNLYDTVKAHGYIQKIFGADSWNDIFYKGKRWYLQQVDDEGNVLQKCAENCTFCIGLDESDSLKSTYNCTRPWIFFDEFISTTYGYSDFIRFCDICKTVIRDNLDVPPIMMSANTIDLNSEWWFELMIDGDIATMVQGDEKYIESDLGTRIHVKILGKAVAKKRALVNMRFWGFNNPKLASITGEGTWATEAYPHIPENEATVLQNIVFIDHGGKLLKLRLMNNEEFGLCVYVNYATKTYKDSIIMTAKELKDGRYMFGLGKDTFLRGYWELYSKYKWYYQNNQAGALVKAFLNLVSTTQIARKG